MDFKSIMDEIKRKIVSVQGKIDNIITKKNNDDYIKEQAEGYNFKEDPHKISSAHYILDSSQLDVPKGYWKKTFQEDQEKGTIPGNIQTLPDVVDNNVNQQRIGNVMAYDFDSTRKDYYDYLISIVDEEQYYREILGKKPSFLRSFIKYLQYNIALWKEDLSKDDSEYRDLYLEDINKAERRVRIAEEVLEENYRVDSVTTNSLIPNTQKKILIFGKTEFPSQKVLFKEDLAKDIPSDYYPHVLELLEGLQTESKVTIEAYKGDSIKGLIKVKKGSTGIRLIFRNLTANMVYVDMILQKKCTNNIVYMNSLESRKKRLDDDYAKVLARIRNGEDLEGLIEENQKILKEIESFLALYSSRKSDPVLNEDSIKSVTIDFSAASIPRRRV